MPLKADPVEVLEERIKNSSSNLADHSVNRYMWFIELDATIVGMVGITSVDWVSGSGEITFIVDRDFHGRGIATSAIAQMLSKVFLETDLDRLVAIVSSGNIASEKVLRKLGFHCEGLLSEGYNIQNELVDQRVFTLSRGEWVHHDH
jgi:ribosomal-protein-alanine N-acetyltransferase